MKRSNKYLTLESFTFLCFTAIIFVIDLITPLGIATGALYPIPVCGSLFLGRDEKLFKLTAIVSIVLVILGILLSPGDLSLYSSINRVFYCVLIIATYTVCNAFKKGFIREIQFEDRFIEALEASPNAMIMVDTSGKIVVTNSYTNKLFGYEEKELISQPVEILVPKEIKNKHPRLRNKFFKSPYKRNMQDQSEIFGVKKDGSYVPLEIGLNPIESHGESYVMASIIDITTRKEILVKLEKQNQKLERANDELMQFSYRTSHDLKGPLTTIKGLSQIMQEDLRDEEYLELSKNINSVGKLAESLENLVQDLLNLAKSDIADDKLEELSFSDICKEVKRINIGLSKDMNVSFDYDVDVNGTWKLPYARVFQIINNLTTNGMKYSNSKNKNKFVKVKIKEVKNKLLILVSDNGLGIPYKHKKDVFDMFKRFHPNDSSGSGLGTYILKKHVDALGGVIDLETSDKGTIFKIEIMKGL